MLRKEGKADLSVSKEVKELTENVDKKIIPKPKPQELKKEQKYEDDEKDHHYEAQESKGSKKEAKNDSTYRKMSAALGIMRPFPGPSREAFGVYSEGRLADGYDPILPNAEYKSSKLPNKIEVKKIEEKEEVKSPRPAETKQK
jgi:hypothetical protein